MPETTQLPYLFSFPPIGAPDEGYLAIAESRNGLPFEIRRTFWTYDTPTGVTRGRHAHYETEMLLIALSGRIRVTLESVCGTASVYELGSPDQGLYIPRLCWHTMQYTAGAVQLVLCSTLYREADYIRDYTLFKQIQADRIHAAHTD